MPNWKKVIVSGSNAVLSSINNDSTVEATNITGSFTGSFAGDGNNLDLSSNTSISTTPFPFAGDGVISGSLLISSSNSTASLTLEGSGSTVFSVQGSQGQLFSLTDDLLHDNLVVGDISGDTIFKVSGSGLVMIPVGDLTGSATATASYGHFIGDGGGLTNLNITTPTLQEVTTQGNITNQGLIVSGSTIFKPLTSSPASIEFSTEAYSARRNPTITLKNALDQKTVHIGQSENDGLFELYNSTETRVVSIQEHSQAFSPPSGISSGYGTYFGVTSSISPTVASPDSYVKIAHDGYSAVPYSILQVNKKGAFAGYNGHQNNSSGSITLQGIMNDNNNSAPTVAITDGNGNKVANFGGPGFVNAVNVHNNYLKYGLQIGGDFTGNFSNMALTDGSLIMSGSTGGFSVKSVSSEAEIKTNGGDTTLTLGTTSSFSYVSASAFKGDGSQLTNLPASDPFPYTASSAAIISRSFASGDTDSTALRLFGSGSVSESGIFEVEGSAGPLFSVADGLDGILMEVNNISGLPLFQVSSSNEVFVNRGNLTSGVTTATASFAYFTGSFQGDGSGLTGLPAASAGSTSGRVVFTTTNGALTTDSGFDYDSTTNQLTVENLNVTHLTSSFITSSTIETSGSNIFGDDTTDTQTLIGTTKITGSAEVTGSLSLTSATNALNFTNTNSTASVSTKLSFRHASGTDYNSLVYFGSNYFRLNNSAYDNAAALYVNGRIQGNNFVAPINSNGYNIASYNSRFTNNYLNLYGSSGVYFGASNAGFATIRDGAAGVPSATYDIDALLGIVSAGNSTGYGFKVHNSDSHETFAVQDNKNAIISGSLLVSGSADFSDATVTGISSDPFPFTGDALITGSLTVSGSGGAKFIVDDALNIHTGVFYGLGRGVVATNNTNQTNILVGNDITGKGAYGSVVVGASATVSNSHHSQVLIGRSTNSVSSYTVAVGNAAEVNTAYGISIGHNAGNDSNTKGINIGGNAKGKGEKGIVISSIGDTNITPTKANTFGIYMTDDSPNFEIEATGSSTLSGSSFTIEKSGSTVFEVIGSEGTLFSVDDDLDGTIFTANDRSGLPVLEASASGEVYIGKAPQSLYTTAVISSNNANVTQSIYGLDTSSYGGAFFEYTAHSGSNARAGNIMAVWNPSDENLDVDMSFNETTTLDIGNTENLVMKVHVSQSQAQLAAFSTTAGYNIKTIIKSI